MQRDSARRGLSPPDESIARERCLKKGVDAPDLASVKDFLRFYVTTMLPFNKARPCEDVGWVGRAWGITSKGR
jgi:hypothetical protein